MPRSRNGDPLQGRFRIARFVREILSAYRAAPIRLIARFGTSGIFGIRARKRMRCKWKRNFMLLAGVRDFPKRYGSLQHFFALRFTGGGDTLLFKFLDLNALGGPNVIAILTGKRKCCRFAFPRPNRIVIVRSRGNRQIEKFFRAIRARILLMAVLAFPIFLGPRFGTGCGNFRMMHNAVRGGIDGDLLLRKAAVFAGEEPFAGFGAGRMRARNKLRIIADVNGHFLGIGDAVHRDGVAQDMIALLRHGKLVADVHLLRAAVRGLHPGDGELRALARRVCKRGNGDLCIAACLHARKNGDVLKDGHRHAARVPDGLVGEALRVEGRSVRRRRHVVEQEVDGARHLDGDGVAFFKGDLGKIGLVARALRNGLEPFEIVREGGENQLGIVIPSAVYDHIQHVARPSQPEDADRTCIADKRSRLALVAVRYICICVVERVAAP